MPYPKIVGMTIGLTEIVNVDYYTTPSSKRIMILFYNVRPFVSKSADSTAKSEENITVFPLRIILSTGCAHSLNNFHIDHLLREQFSVRSFSQNHVDMYLFL